ncbi:MAG: c-type cytochrome biogenesis protein CcsB [bacterium]|nr:c-type cytochrome biogenesis protein CcsB [bacterium]
MLESAKFLLAGALALLIISWLSNLWALNSTKRVAAREAQRVTAGVGAGGAGSSPVSGSPSSSGSPTTPGTTHAELAATGDTPAHRVATWTAIIALVLITAYVILRATITGHGPFSNQHEFAMAFVWSILALYLYFEWRHQMRALSLVAIGVAAGLLLYGMNLDTSVRPLMPALQNNLLLSLHVGTAMLSYGAFCIAFAAAVLYLLRPHIRWKAIPSADALDEVSYRAAVIAYPILTAMIILGAIWAETAWGRYWGWDPKETAALVTWLVWSGYLHARVSRGWRGTKTAWLVVIGFATVLFAYFGNHFFGGLHSYA